MEFQVQIKKHDSVYKKIGMQLYQFFLNSRCVEKLTGFFKKYYVILDYLQTFENFGSVKAPIFLKTLCAYQIFRESTKKFNNVIFKD